MTRVSRQELATALAGLVPPGSDESACIRRIVSYLTDPTPASKQALGAVGVRARDVDDLKPSVGDDIGDVYETAALALMWCRGRTSVPSTSTWSPVVTGFELDSRGELHWATGESLSGLVIRAKTRVRIYSPYLDRGGLAAVGSPLQAAAARGVRIQLGYLGTAERDVFVREWMEKFGSDSGQWDIVRVDAHDAYPHLKIVSIDAASAYIGSANLTYGGLVGNLEVGALVRGPGVAAFEQVLDALLEPDDGPKMDHESDAT